MINFTHYLLFGVYNTILASLAGCQFQLSNHYSVAVYTKRVVWSFPFLPVSMVCCVRVALSYGFTISNGNYPVFMFLLRFDKPCIACVACVRGWTFELTATLTVAVWMKRVHSLEFHVSSRFVGLVGVVDSRFRTGINKFFTFLLRFVFCVAWVSFEADHY